MSESPCVDTLTCALLGHFEDRCPNCGGALGWAACHMTYTTWRCMDCGAGLDSRVVMPEQVHRDLSAAPPADDSDPAAPFSCGHGPPNYLLAIRRRCDDSTSKRR